MKPQHGRQEIRKPRLPGFDFILDLGLRVNKTVASFLSFGTISFSFPSPRFLSSYSSLDHNAIRKHYFLSACIVRTTVKE